MAGSMIAMVVLFSCRCTQDFNRWSVVAFAQSRRLKSIILNSWQTVPQFVDPPFGNRPPRITA